MKSRSRNRDGFLYLPMLKVYFNPGCSKCNEASCLLEEQHIPFEKVEYLTQPPSKQELISILTKLGINAEELVRKGEPIYQQNYLGKKLTDDEFIEAMLQNPILIERPIVIDGERAIICRPPEKLIDFLKKR